MSRSSDKSPPHPRMNRETVTWLHGILASLSQLLRRRDEKSFIDFTATLHQTNDVKVASVISAGEIACGPGCHYCCHARVTVTAPEVLTLARAVQRFRDPILRGAVTDKVRRAAAAVRDLEDDGQWHPDRPCPLLGAKGTCSVYDFRPLSCRAVTARDVTLCQAAFGGRIETAQFVSFPLETRGLLAAAGLKALKDAGYPVAAYELSAALTMALATPDIERRWLAGEDVFADLAEEVDACEHLVALVETQVPVRP